MKKVLEWVIIDGFFSKKCGRIKFRGRAPSKLRSVWNTKNCKPVYSKLKHFFWNRFVNHAFENSTLELFIELSWDNPNWMSKGQSLRHSNDFCFCDSPMKYFAACLTIVRLSYFAERISFFLQLKIVFWVLLRPNLVKLQ